MNLKYARNLLIILILVVALPLSIAQEPEDNGEELGDDNGENGNGDNDVDDSDDESDESENGADNGENDNDENGDAEDENGDVEEEEEETQENDEEPVVQEDEETTPFRTNHGAFVRLVQLERSTHTNFLKGEILLERLDEEISEDDKEELNEILDKLWDLKERVAENREDLSEDPEENVRAFVEFKHEAITLTKEFRDTIRTHVHESERNALRARINREVRASGELDAYKEIMRNRARLHNEQVISEASNGSNIDAQALIERVRTGEVDAKDIKKEFNELIRNVGGQEARDLAQTMRDEAKQQRTNARANQERITEELETEGGDEE